jgi:hypothetical protein
MDGLLTCIDTVYTGFCNDSVPDSATVSCRILQFSGGAWGWSVRDSLTVVHADDDGPTVSPSGTPLCCAWPGKNQDRPNPGST